ncbi:integrating conjugative element protein [Pseudomonas citronellolis]|uniref:integrating conjugative element protein n=1 Tax=Pseudomonas citronellolis TaxID=53408 RepID=UPI0021BF588F|nr:integrating conjugative element protein [Pseudomonas citronellolis]UXJ50122.1 integrating conjugative element protein [Pseudomonas citronellolis]
MKLSCATALLALAAASHGAQPPTEPLIVIEDRGGASALPYYVALDLQPRPEEPAQGTEVPPPPTGSFSEANMLPVQSTLLTPGPVERRVLQAPGLPPLFIIGDDEISRTWLRQHTDRLKALGAVGLVVNVQNPVDLAALRALIPELHLVPTPGDDLAQRLGLRHYPALITATGIEQ